MVSDPIGDFIIRIKMREMWAKKAFQCLFKMKLAIAELLSAQRLYRSCQPKSKGDAKYLDITLLYTKRGQPVVSGVNRISKPSRRLYESAKNIKRFRRGFGMSVFSTPKGIMADADAKKNNLGGEFLFNIW